MSMNKDLVAQAVAAIPLWMAFLNEKEAEQDALLSQMQKKSEGKPTSFTDKATSFLKKKKDDQQAPSETTSSPISLGKSSPGESIPLDGGKPSADDLNAKKDIRWAPSAEDFAAEKEEEEVAVVGSEEEKENNQFSNIF